MRRTIEMLLVALLLLLLTYIMLTNAGCGNLCGCPFGTVCVVVRPQEYECRVAPDVTMAQPDGVR